MFLSMVNRHKSGPLLDSQLSVLRHFLFGYVIFSRGEFSNPLWLLEFAGRVGERVGVGLGGVGVREGWGTLTQTAT